MTDGFVTGLMLGLIVGAVFFAGATILVFWLAGKFGAVEA